MRTSVLPEHPCPHDDNVRSTRARIHVRTMIASVLPEHPSPFLFTPSFTKRRVHQWAFRQSVTGDSPQRLRKAVLGVLKVQTP